MILATHYGGSACTIAGRTLACPQVAIPPNACITFLQDSAQYDPHRWGNVVENDGTMMLPYLASNQSHDQQKILPMLSCRSIRRAPRQQPIICSCPPFSHSQTMCQTDLTKTQTTRWCLVNGLLMLVTKGAGLLIRETTSDQSIRRPTIVTKGKPSENLAVQGAWDCQVDIAARSCWRPAKPMAYTELTENEPEGFHAQRTLSSTPSLRATPAIRSHSVKSRLKVKKHAKVYVGMYKIGLSEL